MVVDHENIMTSVAIALKEDVGTGDITAALLSENSNSRATLISREMAVLCGTPWFNEVFNQLDPSIEIEWHVKDGENITPDQVLCNLSGSTRAILTGERTAINFLQTLSGTATTVKSFVEIIKGTNTQILDTRKTIPGLRLAQKYAVSCGGGKNHRIGLYDAYLIKENHILAKGSVSNAINEAKQSGLPVEVEVENLQELKEALDAEADSILLDNFSLENLKKAVIITQGRAKLEASGNVDKTNLRAIAATGVDYVSIGSLTKHIKAIDFSMRFDSHD